MIREKYNSVIAGQEKLYRAKASVDICVVSALTSVSIAPNHPVTQYIDALGCIIVAFYLLFNGIDILRKNKVAENNEP
jgi:divalent metal cation (Fe/Co/Zn/Cd) transporter